VCLCLISFLFALLCALEFCVTVRVWERCIGMLPFLPSLRAKCVHGSVAAFFVSNGVYLLLVTLLIIVDVLLDGAFEIRLCYP